MAAPCVDIAEDEDAAYEYTAKGNLVGVVSNGSAVLGLGDIGAQASKPVMEGKGVLFKRFADIDVFDVELDTTTPRHVLAVEAMEPTFGGINLEDIEAPECFEIERRLARNSISRCSTTTNTGPQSSPVRRSSTRPTSPTRSWTNSTSSFPGAGPPRSRRRGSTSPSARKRRTSRCATPRASSPSRAPTTGTQRFKQEFARGVDEGGLADAMEGADVLVGLSVGGIVSQEMVRSMADDPIIFAMANPDPEIAYEDAKDARDDTVIMATGRSDYPNQVNNVLGFPFIFRGALDVRATEINEEMKRAAAEALADLARQDVPDAVVKAYGDQPLQFGPDYVIPKPLDPRVLFEVTPAVAEAAIESGAARTELDTAAYVEELEARLGSLAR